MRAIQRLLCFLRGGHRWETTEDPYGRVRACSRCGKLRHAPSGRPRHGTRAADTERMMADERRATLAAREKEG